MQATMTIMQKGEKRTVPSFRRKQETSDIKQLRFPWTPVFTGVTILFVIINHRFRCAEEAEYSRGEHKWRGAIKAQYIAGVMLPETPGQRLTNSQKVVSPLKCGEDSADMDNMLADRENVVEKYYKALGEQK